MPLMAMMTTGNKFPTIPTPQYNSSSNRGRGRNGNGRGRGGRGGNGRGGSSNNNNSFNPSNQSQRPYCQICGKVGHVALDCYYRMDYSYQGRHPLAKLAALASGNNSMPNSSAPNQLGIW